MATIKVPKPPASAYNPKRRASQLLKDQVIHLEWAVRPASQRQPSQFAKIKPPKTEAEAAARIEALTRQLHPDGAKQGLRRTALVAGKYAKRAASRKTKRTAKRRAKKR